jgi:ABC-type sulfate transport system permease component
LVLLAISFAMLLLLNWLQGLQQRAKER